MNNTQVTLHGKALKLAGELLRVGQKAPDFSVVDTDLKPVKLSDFAGKPLVISAVPSLDTEICDLQTRRFNQEAARLGDQVTILTISMDLPFAQKRWCGAAGVDRVKTLSDHRQASFGQAYGLLIEELRLLARAVILVDAKGVVRYVQVVPKIETEPDYNDVMQALKKII